ncbi:interferon regulatory factor 5-like [Sycon ciliatum]|uniref:interferon regulatory factor 5-like n=1 Tax=Sycon ciliatum TaxID=27933 RepID=UPI0031F6B535
MCLHEQQQQSSPYHALHKTLRMARRQKLKDFLRAHLNDGDVPGLEWIDRASETFKIPWKHANRRGNNFDVDRDTLLPRLWAINTMKFDPDNDKADPTRWKTNLRCSLNSLKTSIVRKESTDHHLVYQFINNDYAGRGKRHAVEPLAHNPTPTSSRNLSLDERPVDMMELFPSALGAAQPSSAGVSSSVRTTATPQEDFNQSLSAASFPAPATAPMDGLSLSAAEIDALQLGLPAGFRESDLSQQLTVGSECDIFSDIATTCGANPGFPISGESLLPLRASASSFQTSLVSCATSTHSTSRPDTLDVAIASSKLTPSLPLPAEHALFLQVSYRGYAMAACPVHNQRGCHLYYGQPSPSRPHAAIATPGTATTMSSMAAAASRSRHDTEHLQQLCLPRIQDSDGRFKWPQLRHVLQHFSPGISFEVNGGMVMVRRLCPLHVFYSTNLASAHSQQLLPLQQPVLVFDNSAFDREFHDFRQTREAAEPATRIYFSIGEQFLPGRFSECLLTVTVTMSRAEAVLRDWRAAEWSSGAAQRAVLIDKVEPADSPIAVTTVHHW